MVHALSDSREMGRVEDVGQRMVSHFCYSSSSLAPQCKTKKIMLYDIGANATRVALLPAGDVTAAYVASILVACASGGM